MSNVSIDSFHVTIDSLSSFTLFAIAEFPYHYDIRNKGIDISFKFKNYILGLPNHSLAYRKMKNGLFIN